MRSCAPRPRPSSGRRTDDGRSPARPLRRIDRCRPAPLFNPHFERFSSTLARPRPPSERSASSGSRRCGDETADAERDEPAEEGGVETIDGLLVLSKRQPGFVLTPPAVIVAIEPHRHGCYVYVPGHRWDVAHAHTEIMQAVDAARAIGDLSSRHFAALRSLAVRNTPTGASAAGRAASQHHLACSEISQRSACPSVPARRYFHPTRRPRRDPRGRPIATGPARRRQDRAGI